MEDNELLQALLQVPPNLAFVRERLETGQYSHQQVTEVGYRYAEECWGEDLDSNDEGFYSEEYDYFWRAADAVPGRHSYYLYEVFNLLLQFGLDPNHTVDGDYGIMNYILHIVNGYVAADTLKLLFDHGGNPHLISGGESLLDEVCFDVDFDAVEMTDRRRYDSLIHCWMVFLAYGEASTEEGGTIAVFTEYSDNLQVKFDLKKLKEHRNYFIGITCEPHPTLHIFDKRTFWEVARY